jgi:hypothetical protein
MTQPYWQRRPGDRRVPPGDVTWHADEQLADQLGAACGLPFAVKLAALGLLYVAAAAAGYAVVRFVVFGGDR